MTHRLALASSTPRAATVSARTWRGVRRAVSIGIFAVATAAAVVVGTQSATTSPVASAADAAPAPRSGTTGPVTDARVDPAVHGHGHRRP